MTLFDTNRDKEEVEQGGFWCYGCLIGKPANEQSDDPRYCHGCFKFLVDEAVLLPEKQKKLGWVPVPNPSESLPAGKKDVAKLANTGKIPWVVLQHLGGRPRKTGEVHRTTTWRRKKEEAIHGVPV